MATQRMTIEAVEYDDTRETLVFSLYGEQTDYPPPPGLPADTRLRVAPLRVTTLPMSMRRATVTQPTATYYNGFKPDGSSQLWQITWTGSGWSAPVALP